MSKPAPRFADRRAAGRLLAERLMPLALRRPVVIALSNGGVPVGFEIARAVGGELQLVRCDGEIAPPPELLFAVQFLNRPVVMVDDGTTPAGTVLQIVGWLLGEAASSVTLATPALPADAIATLTTLCDHLACLASLTPTDRVEDRFGDFHEIDQAEVDHLLRDAGDPHSPPAPPMIDRCEV